MTFLQSKNFWRPFVLFAVLLSAFFAWELGYFGDALPKLARPPVTQSEIIFTIILIALLSLNAGLAFFRLKLGTCPLGAKRASTVAGGLGFLVLLCPVCLILPFSVFGLTIGLAFLAPFLPLIRVVVMFLLIVSTIMLWPKENLKS